MRRESLSTYPKDTKLTASMRLLAPSTPPAATRIRREKSNRRAAGVWSKGRRVREGRIGLFRNGIPCSARSLGGGFRGGICDSLRALRSGPDL